MTKFHLELDVKKQKLNKFSLIILDFSVPLSQEKKVKFENASAELVPSSFLEIEVYNSIYVNTRIPFPKSIMDKVISLGKEIKNVLSIKENLDGYGLIAEYLSLPGFNEEHNYMSIYANFMNNYITLDMKNVLANRLYRPNEILDKIQNMNVNLIYENTQFSESEFYWNKILFCIAKILSIYPNGFLKIYTQMFNITSETTTYIMSTLLS